MKMAKDFDFACICGYAKAKGPVPLERIAVAITSDYEIPAFLGIRR